MYRVCSHSPRSGIGSAVGQTLFSRPSAFTPDVKINLQSTSHVSFPLRATLANSLLNISWIFKTVCQLIAGDFLLPLGDRAVITEKMNVQSPEEVIL